MLESCELYILAAVIVLYFAGKAYIRHYYDKLYWTWDNGADDYDLKRVKIDTSDLSFPRGFKWGVATAAHQIEGGCDNNNWAEWEKTSFPDGTPHIRGFHRAGQACDHWNRVDEDVNLMKELGVNSYRMSIEWSKIEPKQGQYDRSVVDHYHREFDALLQKGIQPCVTFHHFTHPTWFEQKGSFEHEENIDIFVQFCVRMFEEYSSQVKMWATINEPEVIVTNGWMTGLFPPGKKDFQLAGVVMKNVLEAHVRAYHAIKMLPAGQSPYIQVGIVKDIFQFDPWNPLNPLDIFFARMIHKSFNQCIIDYFKTGVFEWYMPGSAYVKYENKKAIKAMDFIGLNYYSHFHVKFRFAWPRPFGLVHLPGCLINDYPFPIYPEGLYRALMYLKEELNLPIVVTENGVADAQDDRRPIGIRRYIYALSKAIRDGADVRGYFHWSLMDNYEWHEGYHIKFGLCDTDFATQKRTIRPSGRYYQSVVKRFSH